MPSRPLRPCSYPGCPELVKAGYCDAHKRTQPDYHIPEHQRMYNSARWKRMRKAQLTREPWCVDCLAQGVYTVATDVDHIAAHRGDERLFYDANNLQSLCHSCHSRKTASEVFPQGRGA